MIDESDTRQEKRWFDERRASLVVKALQARNIGGQYVPTRLEALSTLLNMIPPGSVVARGDSVTLEQVGIIAEIKKSGRNRVIDPFERDEDGNFVAELEEMRRMQREAFFSDVFLSGTNAITLDGKLVNVDGVGGRVAAMLFGPGKVLIVCGVNKIVQDVDCALERICSIAAPINAARHYIKHHRTEFGELPCVVTGKCMDCSHDWRICRYTVIIEGSMIGQKERIHVVLVGEDLGI